MKIEIPDEFFNKEELKNTPLRWKGFMKEWLEDSKNFKFTTFKNEGYDEMIIWSGKGFSLCAHHVLPILINEIHIAYIPKDKICGLSKLQRVFEFFAHRPQLQEKLTKQIADYLQEKLEPLGVAILMKSSHLCVSARGAKVDGIMTTTKMTGVFLKSEPGKSPKQEFFDAIRNGK